MENGRQPTRAQKSDIARMEAQLASWRAEIEAMAGGFPPTADSREPGRPHVEDLTAQWTSLQERFVVLRAAGDDAWEAFRPGIEAAWNDLSAAMAALRNVGGRDRRP